MTKEKLKPFGLTEEEIDKIAEKHLTQVGDHWCSVSALEENNIFDFVRDLEKASRTGAGGGWVSVDDRLPEENSLCLIVVKGVGIKIDLFHPKFGYWDNYVDITHWQPLPQPPKTEEQMEFNIGDVVKYVERFYEVSGVIHDDERLFLWDEDDTEFEIRFSEVEEQYIVKPTTGEGEA